MNVDHSTVFVVGTKGDTATRVVYNICAFNLHGLNEALPVLVCKNTKCIT